jgi:hypothetical protein
MQLILIQMRNMSLILYSSTSVCGTVRINRDLPRDMTEEANKMLKKGKATFRRKQISVS